MSKKIYLSPSNQINNLYASGNTNECEQCNKIAEYEKMLLKDVILRSRKLRKDKI